MTDQIEINRDTAVEPVDPKEWDKAQLYINRELSWLEFNDRVLHEALDARTPLLDRLLFLSIFTSNLDEFFMKRVGGLKRQVAAGVQSQSSDGLTPQEQLLAIRERTIPMLRKQALCFREEIKPALRDNGIHLLTWSELTPAERDEANDYFAANVYPVLTPLAVDVGHPFPFLSNLSDSLGIVLRHPEMEERMFARVKIPSGILPSWVRLQSGGDPEQYRFVSLIEMIRRNVESLFEDMEIVGVMPFRVTRNADVERDEEDAEDLLELITDELRARRFSNVVRLEHGPAPDPWVLRFLIENLELTENDVYELDGELDYTDLQPIIALPHKELKRPGWTPQIPPALADEEIDIFGVIRAGDQLVHHPYESFSASVERFIRTAAYDPRVLAIKMTLYRTGDDSPFIDYLIRAAEAGKQVVCLVELQARFDEQRNIECAQKLENAGVHVVYGIIGLKTHTKTALVVRREQDGLRCYAHIGTGNYHVGTAKLYTDLGLLTAKPEFTGDVVELFNYLTGRSLRRKYRKLLVAPVNMRDRFLEMIEREIEHHAAGRPARIVAKMNQLQDRRIIRGLYRASQAGVPVDLIVRGFCCLRPGVEGLSDNIRVISVIGHFLEHSRIYHFSNGQDDPRAGEYYIGSADWMYRNLGRRVEAITPIEDRALRERLWQILTIMRRDERQAWDMQPDGSYVQRQPSDPEIQIGTHETMMRLYDPKRGAVDPSLLV
jgi:polyphosphate kinase